MSGSPTGFVFKLPALGSEIRQRAILVRRHYLLSVRHQDGKRYHSNLSTYRAFIYNPLARPGCDVFLLNGRSHSFYLARFGALSDVR